MVELHEKKHPFQIEMSASFSYINLNLGYSTIHFHITILGLNQMVGGL